MSGSLIEVDWPTLVRGDIAYGNDEMMAGCEQLGLAYLMKLLQSQRGLDRSEIC